jgi:glycosyltransferase involved in cell wall biosynthesis
MPMGKSKTPAKEEKIKGTVSFYSNSPDQPTGYGQQTRLMIDRLKKVGLDVAALSNYGQEGINGTVKTPSGDVILFARGFDLYSNDSAPIDHQTFTASKGNKKSVFFTLYDVWVLNNPAFDKLNIMSWVPLDHITMPPLVEKWLKKDNVRPVAMAPHGVRQMEKAGIECDYAPHSFDGKVMYRRNTIEGIPVQEHMGTKDKFVVGIFAANKASGLVHRKSFSENLLAFSLFKKKHTDAVLYIHTEPLGKAGGWNLLKLLDACGLSKDDVIFPNPLSYKYGIPADTLAGYYSGLDVLLATSYGEGFGVPTIEAQACGVRVIGSDWAATADLVSEDGWLVNGQPQYDSGQDAWWQIPNVPSIVFALEEAYKIGKGSSQVSINFASEFEVETVWQNHWMPILRRTFG